MSARGEYSVMVKTLTNKTYMIFIRSWEEPVQSIYDAVGKSFEDEFDLRTRM